MATIAELRQRTGATWFQQWKPAMFRGARFHVDAGVKESGRRIVPHEFPKRDIPYAEDMGRRAREFTVRGYIVAYPRDEQGSGLELSVRNYIPARNRLIDALEAEGPAVLQLPLLGSLNVAVVRYRVTETNREGGYCVFDMTFIEYGKAPGDGTRQGSAAVESGAQNLGDTIKQTVETKIAEITV